ncbi:MAG: GYD domain-containing protein [Chloroflexi bacterium]|nr:GYD domain-containing protein [Chloroflexota bacterium]MCI0574886.1 GYD domain-containing protein [Chloroflexota bacterium]MCI0648388.1 GYD domain-containing protein [Chloroflexota bacterium]MCI0727509.1 GYD domain-containing protein [Chloroflexota bacterium]
MPAYVVLTKFTDQGVRAVKDTVKRAQAAREQIEAAGGRVIGIWWLLGEFDSMLIVEMPDQEKAMQLSLAIGMQGNIRTQTLQAFSEEEMERIVQGLP